MDYRDAGVRLERIREDLVAARQRRAETERQLAAVERERDAKKARIETSDIKAKLLQIDSDEQLLLRDLGRSKTSFAH